MLRLRTSRRYGDIVAGGPHCTPYSHAAIRYLFLDLDISYPSSDSGYVASAFLNFACVNSEDELPCFVSILVYIRSLGILQ